MNRREVLQLFGAAPVAAVLPLPSPTNAGAQRVLVSGRVIADEPTTWAEDVAKYRQLLDQLRGPESVVLLPGFLTITII